MVNFIISGTIGGEYEFPNDMFRDYCYEGWGNCWSMIDGINARYIPAQTIIDNPQLLDSIDIIMAEFGHQELHRLAYKYGVFNIATESGAGFDIDREQNKLQFINRLDSCSLLLSTTHAGKEYLSMFTDTPVLDIPLPMDMVRFQPRNIDKYNEFTICIGEIIESCYDDRPLQFTALAIARSLGIPVVSSIGMQSRNFDNSNLEQLRFNPILHPHTGLYEISNDYLAHSHISMMLGQRSTFGRFVYVSWAIGIPCIATRYQCQWDICPELTVSYEQIDIIKNLINRLQDDNYYNNCKQKGLQNVRSILSSNNIALRIINEILPIYFKDK